MPQRAPDSWWYGRVAGRPKSGRELESSWRVGADASFRALLIWLPRIGLLKRVAPSRPLAVCGWSSVFRCARSRGSQSSELQAALTAHGEAASRASRVPPSVSHFAPPSLLASANHRRRARCTARCLGATTRRLGVRDLAAARARLRGVYKQRAPQPRLQASCLRPTLPLGRSALALSRRGGRVQAGALRRSVCVATKH